MAIEISIKDLEHLRALESCYGEFAAVMIYAEGNLTARLENVEVENVLTYISQSLNDSAEEDITATLRAYSDSDLWDKYMTSYTARMSVLLDSSNEVVNAREDMRKLSEALDAAIASADNILLNCDCHKLEQMRIILDDASYCGRPVRGIAEASEVRKSEQLRRLEYLDWDSVIDAANDEAKEVYLRGALERCASHVKDVGNSAHLARYIGAYVANNYQDSLVYCFEHLIDNGVLEADDEI